MIPVLFPTNATSWTTNGLGGLADAVSCSVQEERNGAYKMTMVYPVDGLHYSETVPGSPILCDCGGQRGKQVFRVSKITRPINGQVKIEAEHLSYQLSLIPCSPFSASSVTAALTGLTSHAAVTCPFTFWTNKSTIANYSQDAPASIRSRLGGVQGSILDVYGGEWEFDNYTCRLWNARGSNKGVTIRYGKNLTDLTQEENIANTITGVYPYYISETAYVELPEKTLDSASAANYPFPRTVPLDLSQGFNDTPTEAQLRAKAQAYLNGSGIGVPKVSLKIKFVNLADTDEYAAVAALESVELCDTVTVIYEKLGVQATAKVIKTDWDVLAERYNSVEVGDAKTTLADTIAQTHEEVATAVTTSAMEKAVQQATAMITGATGGYVKWNYNGDGHPYEMLIMDAEQEADATNIWRFNANGWGFSRNGGASYTTAATIDGGIIADFITAGTLTGLNINNGSGTFTVDSAGNLTASAATITNGAINNGNGTFSVDSAGNVTANSLTSSNATITGGSMQVSTTEDTAVVKLTSSTGYSEVMSNGFRFVRYISTQNVTAVYQMLGQNLYMRTYAGNVVNSWQTATPTTYCLLTPSSLTLYDGSNSALYDTNLYGSIGKVLSVGTVTSSDPSSVGLSSATWTTLASISHGTGTYLVCANVAFNNSSSGRRIISVTSSGTTDSAIQRTARNEQQPSANGTTYCSVSFVTTATSSGTWYLRGYQSSGAALSGTPSIQIIKLRDS